MAIYSVRLTTHAKKDLHNVPKQVFRKLMFWIQHVENQSLERTRMIPGFHDEALIGKRMGQRSIRLNIAYRAIYEIRRDQSIEFVSIEEITKHDY